MEWSVNEWLFYGGIIIMSASAVAAGIAVILSLVSKQKLTEQLKEEYGPRQY